MLDLKEEVKNIKEDFSEEVEELVKKYSDIIDSIPDEFETPKEKLAYLKGYTAATRDYSSKLQSVAMGSYREEEG